MRYERVYMVWDIYDGPRTGIANVNGMPHYFSSIFDEAADEYSARFTVSPVGDEFLDRALRQWTIFRSWELQFHQGAAGLDTHPGHGGIDAEYDSTRTWLKGRMSALEPAPYSLTADFRAVAGQDDPPHGVLRELEVAWSRER